MYFDQGEQRELKVAVMWKRAQGKKKVLSSVNWKERVFVLTPKTLNYFEGNYEKRGKCRGSIALSSVKAVECVDDTVFDQDKRNCFQVVYDDLVLYISANGDEERKDWVEAIQDECRGNKFLLKEYHPGIFVNKWTCCGGGEKSTQGCKSSFASLENNGYQGGSYTQSSTFIASQPLPPIPSANQAVVAPQPHKETMKEPEKKATETVVAIYDFFGAEQGDLSLTKGENLTVIEKQSDHWWIAKNSSGEQGFIPSNYVRRQGLESESWFQPEMSRQMSEDVLKEEGKEGCFLVRNSSREGMYTLSVFSEPVITRQHLQLQNCFLKVLLSHQSRKGITDLCHHPVSDMIFEMVGLRLLPSLCIFFNLLLQIHWLTDIWEIPRAEIVLGKELGTGQFGTVRQGTWRRSIAVAVKLMKEGAMSEDDFIDEAKVMTQFHHPHLVQLFGVCSEKPIYIITEFMSQGCLLHYLRKNQPRLKSPQMTEMVRQVSLAMAYLESRNFIHRDLAARNCLIGDKNIVKVADFGLARYVIDDEYTASEGTKFPIKWASPEVILYTKFSSKSDIWAFGILTWEIYSGGKQPYPAINNTEVVQKVINGYRLEKPQRCPDDMYRMVTKCWQTEPEHRPNFASVKKSVSDFMGEDYDETFE
ncbi:PREDICTED: tyrosine-protein kinase BTK-like [Acropora digitifera]|uniref:tyrosine-protein kinase BTK-like n=1 Tax=Acropora digitifera TaxID=70779 RepID=UPI00077A186A|nr:PREDICTED: tyrosine-protein kinase BTK-like [Acropora digitifera]